MIKCPNCNSQNVMSVWDGDTGIGDPRVCQECTFYFDWYEIREQLKGSAASRLTRLSKMESAVKWLPTWRQWLTIAIAIMDERGRSVPGNSSSLFQDSWDQLGRQLLLTVESIEYHRDAIDEVERGDAT